MNMRDNPKLSGAATVVFVAMVILFLPWLGETLFNSKGEPREAIVAVSMLESGNWILPVNYGSDIPFKPPFLAWLIAVFSWIFNGGVVTEYLSRLPSALACMAMVFGGYRWASRIRGERFGLIFSVITLTCFEVFRAGMACRLDMVLTACMVLGLYSFYELCDGMVRHRGATWVWIWFLLSCAAMTKGPVGSLLPCFIAGTYFLLRGKPFWATFFKMISVAVAALLPLAAWTYAAYQQGGDAFLDLMYEENFGRLFGTMSYSSHENPFWYNFVTLIAGLLPWTLLIIFSLFNLRKRYRSPMKPAGLFALTAAALTVLFYCIPASKRSVYLLPAYPFICYGIANIMEWAGARKALKAYTWVMAVLAILAPVIFGVAQFVDIDKIVLEPISWWCWAVLLIPVILGAAWIANRHSPAGHSIAIVWSLYLAYISVIMPSVLNPRSDIHALDQIPHEAGVEIYSLGPQGTVKPRFFTLNYYLNDRIRPIESVLDGAGKPAGTVLLIDRDADTTGLWRYYDYKPLLQRSCDHRRPLGIAIKNNLNINLIDSIPLSVNYSTNEP